MGAKPLRISVLNPCASAGAEVLISTSKSKSQPPGQTTRQYDTMINNNNNMMMMIACRSYSGDPLEACPNARPRSAAPGLAWPGLACCRYGRREVAELLMEAGADLDAENDAKQKPVDVARLNKEVAGGGGVFQCRLLSIID